jgi:uncharacterized protein YlaI
LNTEELKNLVIEAYCHNGHSLICKKNKINSHPSIKLMTYLGKKEVFVYLSTVINEHDIKLDKNLKNASVLNYFCPHCKEELDSIAPCSDIKGGKFLAIYTNKKRNLSSALSICNVPSYKKMYLESSWKVISNLVK